LVFHAAGLAIRTVAPDTVPPGRFVELPGRGTTFAVDVAGPPGAPTLFLLHGLAVTGYLNWFPAFAALAEDFRVVSMDLRGHGRGIPLSGRFKLSDCADDADALADVLGVEQVVPVGYSLGGPVAQLMWRRHPKRVAGMVLCATSRNFGGTPHERAFYSTLIAGIYGIRAVRHLPGPFHHPVAVPTSERIQEEIEHGRIAPWAIAELRQASPQVVLQAMRALGGFTSHRWVGEIDVPTAVVVTTKDRFVAADRQLKLARAIPGATIHPTHASHAACVLGAQRFVPSLVEACRSVAARLDPVPGPSVPVGDGSVVALA
jgi:3-oxoadipate enol-lactonase